jgi:uncharacterized Zn-finger protein
VQQHSEEVSKFKCHTCSKVFDKWRKCSLHIWKVHKFNLDLFSCDLCPNFKTSTANQLEVHNQIHSKEKKFACSICMKNFAQLAQLKNHTVTHMDKNKDSVPVWYSKKQCELCQKYFADSKCLKKHVQAVHSKLKPYICHVCNHQSSRKAMLDMHMRQHTGEKPFK